MLKSLKQTKRTLFQRPHFSSSALSDFAKTAFFEETRKMQEEATYKTLMENLQKVFFLEEKSKSSRDFLAQCFQRLSLNAKTPLKDILEHYQSKNRLGFDEELLALSLDYLARTMKSITPGRKATEDCSVRIIRLLGVFIF